MDKLQVFQFSGKFVARTAGIALLLMAIAAGLSIGVFINPLIDMENLSGSVLNIRESEGLFRAGVAGWLLIFLLDIIVAWAFYVYLSPVNKQLSLLGGWLRLMYTAILGIAIFCLALIPGICNGSFLSMGFEPEQSASFVAFFFSAFQRIWSLGLIVFGFHLLVTGYLMLRADYIPKWLGVLMIIAAIGYVLVDAGYWLLPAQEAQIALMEKILSVPMAAGELVFAIWLLIKGGKLRLSS
ncbi:MAG: DUF4386 domain-containing protein [Bacteroidetes bacterium]|nr:DUF4386 domain-containing protein [Bacteroidota bacterium]